MSILELCQYNEVKGEIYKIYNTKNDKIYIGQTRSHRKNKGKYRPFGYIGRFKDHISEAINNTKENQCTYLNNSIRKEKDFFKVELLEICDISDLDEKEKFYIKKYDSYYPNGYNLTIGGKTFKFENVDNEEKLNQSSKRGRDFGYKHNQDTKNKIKERLEEIKEHLKLKASTNERKSLVSNNITEYYDNKKIEKFSKFEINENIEKYIKPIFDRNNNIISYKIYFDRNNKYESKSKLQNPEFIFNRLKNILIKAKELKSKNC
jgi:hypothetical protein